MHKVRLSGASESNMPQEGVDAPNPGSSETSKKQSKEEKTDAEAGEVSDSYTYTYETEEEGGDEGEEDPNEEEEEVPLQADTLEEFPSAIATHKRSWELHKDDGMACFASFQQLSTVPVWISTV